MKCQPNVISSTNIVNSHVESNGENVWLNAQWERLARGFC